MASITKRTGRNGKVSYLIRVSTGYGPDGRQRKPSMTWVPPEGMPESKIEKELQRQAVLFEEQCNAGTYQDGTIRFADFAKKWMEEFGKKQLKIKTWTEYEKRLVRINQALGHIKLKNLKTGHINSFYSNLQEEGMNVHTGGTLAPSTVRAYHGVISSILSKAVKWGYISHNPALNAELPKMEKKEAPHLDEEDARLLLQRLHDESIKYRAMITFDLLSGLRRGELLGLRWDDVDFRNETITIRQASAYVSGQGIFVDTPKNHTSSRPLKLSRTAFLLLNEYKQWQDRQRELSGDRWKDEDNRIFTNEEGGPIHPDSLTKWFAKFIKKNGFPKVTVHSLRHTYASLMIADGTPLVVVSRRLGQASLPGFLYAHLHDFHNKTQIRHKNEF